MKIKKNNVYEWKLWVDFEHQVNYEIIPNLCISLPLTLLNIQMKLFSLLMNKRQEITTAHHQQPLFLHFTAMFTFAFVFLFWKGIDQSALLLTIFSDVKFVYIYGAVHRFLLWVNRMFTFGFESGITIEGEKLRINFLSSIGGNYGLIHLVRNY